MSNYNIVAGRLILRGFVPYKNKPLGIPASTTRLRVPRRIRINGPGSLGPETATLTDDTALLFIPDIAIDESRGLDYLIGSYRIGTVGTTNL